MRTATPSDFNRQYEAYLKHLRLKGLQPKTIDVYARAIRRIGAYFDHRIDDLSEAQLLEYFTDRLETHSWSSVKHDLYGLKFFYAHVLRKPWVAPGLVKPPKSQRLPDIVTVAEAARLFDATRICSGQAVADTFLSSNRHLLLSRGSSCFDGCPGMSGVVRGSVHHTFSRSDGRERETGYEYPETHPGGP